MAARPCPARAEPLVVPPVVRRGGGEDECGGGGGGDGGAEEGDAQLEARLDFLAMCGLQFDEEDEYGRPLEAQDDGGIGEVDLLSDMRQCPRCNLGPLYNENCSDMSTHHGECQSCEVRLCSRQKLDQMVADRLVAQREVHRKKSDQNDLGVSEADDSSGLSVLAAVPNCRACLSRGLTSKVWYNGCMGCGLSFTSTPWHSLPPYEPPLEMYEAAGLNAVRIPRRRAYLDRVRRERRAARSVAVLAEQLQDQIVAFLHNKRALADEQRRKATTRDRRGE